MPILHHYPLSAGSRFVRLVMAEFGETPTLTEEQPWERGERLLKLNPAGTVPVLIDDDETAVVGRHRHRRISERDPRGAAGRNDASDAKDAR